LLDRVCEITSEYLGAADLSGLTAGGLGQLNRVTRMDEEHTDWLPVEAALMKAVGVRIAAPAGELTAVGGRIVIGTMRLTRGRITAIPREGLAPAQEEKVASAAFWAMVRGPRDHHWRLDPTLGWCAEVYVRQESGLASASARKMAMLSGEGVPISQSSSGCRSFAPLPWLARPA
jgi:hypothetical protein